MIRSCIRFKFYEIIFSNIPCNSWVIIFSFQVFHDMANFVRSESIVSLNCCKDSEVIDIPRCYYTRWAGEDNVKEDLIILENLYPQVLLIYHKSSIRSRPLIQVYSIRSQTIKKCDTLGCYEKFTFFIFLGS